MPEIDIESLNVSKQSAYVLARIDGYAMSLALDPNALPEAGADRDKYVQEKLLAAYAARPSE